MSRLIRLSSLLAISLLFLAAAAVVSYSQDGGPQRVEPYVIEGAFDPRALATYDLPQPEIEAASTWTGEDFRAAQPLPMLELAPGDLAAAAWQAAAPTGPLEVIPGGLPEPEALAFVGEAQLSLMQMLPAEAVDVAPLAAGVGASGGYGYPPPYTQTRVNYYSQMWKAFPYSAIGKLYFRVPGDSGAYMCTGAVAVGRAVWTAGHCVYTPGKGWHTDVVFVPAAREGAQPYGAFSVRQMSTLSGWIEGNLAYDIAIVVVADRDGKTISQYTGYFGALFNASPNQHFHSFGYPGKLHNGAYTYACAASTSRTDGLSGPEPVGMGCDMGPGSSGGPRVVGFQPYAAGAMNYINGVNSYHYTGQALEAFAAYFDNGAKGLYDWGKIR